MNKKEQQIKKSLIKAVHSVRKKFQTLHNARSGEELKNFETFKPITGKLDTLIDMQSGNKPEPLETVVNKDGSVKDLEMYDHQYEPPKTDMLSKSSRISKIRKQKGVKSTIRKRKSQQISDKYKSLKSNRERTATLTEYRAKLLAGLKKYNADNVQPQPSTSVSVSIPASEHDHPIIIAKPKTLTPRNETASGSNQEPIEISDDGEEEGGAVALDSSKPTKKKTSAAVKKERTRFDFEEEDGTDVENQPRKFRVKARPSSTTTNKNLKRGNGMIPTNAMQHSNNEYISYTYWDDPNELVNRLRLLVASKSAGHSGHTNEIMSIIEELREAGIIV